MLWLRNFILEITPVITFFVVENWFGFFNAVIASVAVTGLSVVMSKVIDGAIPRFAIVSLPILIIFSSFSVVLQNEQFFIVTDTIFYTIFAGALFYSLRTRKTLMQSLFESSFAMTEHGWRTLTIRWLGFFVLLAASNEFVRLMYTPDMWVNYKLVMVPVTILFGCYQFTLSARERIPAESNRLGLRTNK